MFELGNNLRAARQHRRIDLVIAEQDTKIRSKYLAALESEDFDILPGPVFVRGFLRTYSRYLGLDPQLFIEEYNARFGRFEDVDDHHSPALGRPGLAQAREQRGRRTMRSLVVMTLIAIAGIAWLGLRETEHTPAAETPSARDTSAPASTQPAKPAVGSLGVAANAAAPTVARPTYAQRKLAATRAKQRRAAAAAARAAAPDDTTVTGQ